MYLYVSKVYLYRVMLNPRSNEGKRYYDKFHFEPLIKLKPACLSIRVSKKK